MELSLPGVWRGGSGSERGCFGGVFDWDCDYDYGRKFSRPSLSRLDSTVVPAGVGKRAADQIERTSNT